MNSSIAASMIAARRSAARAARPEAGLGERSCGAAGFAAAAAAPLPCDLGLAGLWEPPLDAMLEFDIAFYMTDWSVTSRPPRDRGVTSP
jgi:hypothetical protein